MVYVLDINQPCLPAPFYSVILSISVFTTLSIAFHSINSPDNSPLSHSALSALILPSWSFRQYTSSWQSSNQTAPTSLKNMFNWLLHGEWFSIHNNRLPKVLEYPIASWHIHVHVAQNRGPRGLTFSWWGCCGLCFRHKPTELAHSCLFCYCVYFCL